MAIQPLDSTTIEIAGADRLRWLNNLVSNDVVRSPADRAVEVFVPDVKGRILSHGLVIPCAERDSAVYWSLGIDQAPRLLPHFDKYLIREAVQLPDKASAWRWAWCQTAAAAAGWLSIDEPLAEATEKGTVIAAGPRGLAVAGFLAPGAWLVGLAAESETASDGELEADPGGAFEWHRIAARWPRRGVDFDDKNLPQELDRDATAISFRKGCYLGQETIARLDALGQVQKKLVALRIEPAAAALPLGPLIATSSDGQTNEAGWLTSAAPAPDGSHAVALGYVKRAYLGASGTLLHHGGAVVQRQREIA